MNGRNVSGVGCSARMCPDTALKPTREISLECKRHNVSSKLARHIVSLGLNESLPVVWAINRHDRIALPGLEKVQYG